MRAVYSHDQLALADEALGRIQSEDARRAYRFFLEGASRWPAYDAYPARHGFILDFRFYHPEAPTHFFYAFIVNRDSLLWYFRKPMMRRYPITLAQVQAVAPDARQNPKGEIVAPLRTLSHAEAITTLMV